jgi:lysophospholipase L1-like esterase
MKVKLFVTITLCVLLNMADAQTKHAFWDDVQTIKAYDKLFQPPSHPILFVGSSSIRKWDNLQWVFAKYNILNRGVGGTVINDIIFYLEDIVLPYQPKQIVLYIGENDITHPEETADKIANRTVRLFRVIRLRLPGVPVAYISIKPSPSRIACQQKAVQTNLLIKNYLAKQSNASYIDLYPLMLTADGKMRPELFVGDMLHMNDKGYAIWQKAIEPYLTKN